MDKKKNLSGNVFSVTYPPNRVGNLEQNFWWDEADRQQAFIDESDCLLGYVIHRELKRKALWRHILSYPIPDIKFYIQDLNGFYPVTDFSSARMDA